MRGKAAQGGVTGGRWECAPHTARSPYYGSPERPGHTLWPHGAIIQGLTAADARLVGEAPRVLAALRAVLAAGGRGRDAQAARRAAERVLARVDGRRGR